MIGSVFLFTEEVSGEGNTISERVHWIFRERDIWLLSDLYSFLSGELVDSVNGFWGRK